MRVYSAAKQKPPSLKTAADSLHRSAALPNPHRSAFEACPADGRRDACALIPARQTEVRQVRRQAKQVAQWPAQQHDHDSRGAQDLCATDVRQLQLGSAASLGPPRGL